MDGQERTKSRRRRVAIDASEPEARPWGGRSGEALGAGFIPRSVEIRNRDEWLQGATLKWVTPRSGVNKDKERAGNNFLISSWRFGVGLQSIAVNIFRPLRPLASLS